MYSCNLSEENLPSGPGGIMQRRKCYANTDTNANAKTNINANIMKTCLYNFDPL